MFPYSAVAWDIDGTLIDSEPLHFSALLAVCEKFGRIITDSENQAALGLSLDSVWDVMRLADDIPTGKESWRLSIHSHYIENVSIDMARAGAVDAVGFLDRIGVPQVFVTTAEREIAEANLKALGLAGRYPLVAKEDVINTKPHPEPYLKAVSLLGQEPERCLAIEDTSIGSVSAASAGLFTVVWPNAMTRGLAFPAAHKIVEYLGEIPGFEKL
jgi:beta-phosphoglucomutase-like phosphatase (HAD superfamily)